MFHKFTLVAPVWFQMVPGDKLTSEQKIDMKIQGEHDVDRGWISEVKSTGAKVVPRLIFEKWSPKILKQLLENEKINTVSFKTKTFMTNYGRTVDQNQSITRDVPQSNCSELKTIVNIVMRNSLIDYNLTN